MLITNSICVAASCLDKLGNIEYRGVDTKTGEIIFHQRLILNSTNSTDDSEKFSVELLAIVHALAYLKKQGSDIAIYSNSETAILWVMNKDVWTTLKQCENDEAICNLIKRAVKWLETNIYSNMILKWDTQSWGEIPARFGEKQSLNDVHRLNNSPHESPQVKMTISGNTYPFREQLKKAGLRWLDHSWSGTFPLSKIERLKQFCRHHDLQYIIEGENFKESKLPSSTRPLSSHNIAAIMGEGKLQWEIEEMLDTERLRTKKSNRKKQKKR